MIGCKYLMVICTCLSLFRIQKPKTPKFQIITSVKESGRKQSFLLLAEAFPSLLRRGSFSGGNFLGYKRARELGKFNGNAGCSSERVTKRATGYILGHALCDGVQGVGRFATHSRHFSSLIGIPLARIRQIFCLQILNKVNFENGALTGTFLKQHRVNTRK